MLTSRVLRGLVPIFVCALLAGCAGTTDDSDSSSSAEVTNTAYDDAVRNGPKMETDKTVTDTESASTHLVGYIAAAEASAIAEKMVSLGRWSEIRTASGKQPFTKAQVRSDERSGDHTVKAQLTIKGRFAFDFVAVSKAEEEGFDVNVTNSESIGSILVGGTIISAGKLVVDAKIFPYASGVIVDATMRVKAKKFEEKAAEATETVGDLFRWLAEPAEPAQSN